MSSEESAEGAVEVPERLKEAVGGETLAAIYEALAPPAEERLEEAFEIEVEAPGEGTFTLRYEDGSLEGEKGFADEPFVSCEVPKGGWPLVREVLQAAVCGFPDSPVMARRQAVTRALKRAELSEAYRGLAKLKDALLEVEIPEAGTFRLARGALDEATRTLTVKVPKGGVDAALAGDLGPLSSAKLSGDKRLQGDLLAALGSAWLRVQSA